MPFSIIRLITPGMLQFYMSKIAIIFQCIFIVFLPITQIHAQENNLKATHKADIKKLHGLWHVRASLSSDDEDSTVECYANDKTEHKIKYNINIDISDSDDDATATETVKATYLYSILNGEQSKYSKFDLILDEDATSVYSESNNVANEYIDEEDGDIPSVLQINILSLDEENYQYILIATPDLRLVWLLTREESTDKIVYAKILAKAMLNNIQFAHAIHKLQWFHK